MKYNPWTALSEAKWWKLYGRHTYVCKLYPHWVLWTYILSFKQENMDQLQGAQLNFSHLLEFCSHVFRGHISFWIKKRN